MEVFFAEIEQEQPCDRSRERGQDECQEGFEPPQVSADEEHHGHVAHAQAFFFPEEIVGGVDEKQERCPSDRTDERLPQPQVRPKESVDKSKHESRKSDLVGKDLVEVIDETEGDKCTHKEAGRKKMEAQRMLIIEKKKAKRRQYFDHGVNNRDPQPAGPALAPKKKERKDGDVVVRFDSFSAAGAGRRRPDKALPAGKTVDDDVEEASPG